MPHTLTIIQELHNHKGGKTSMESRGEQDNEGLTVILLSVENVCKEVHGKYLSVFLYSRRLLIPWLNISCLHTNWLNDSRQIQEVLNKFYFSEKVQIDVSFNIADTWGYVFACSVNDERELESSKQESLNFFQILPVDNYDYSMCALTLSFWKRHFSFF